MIAVHPEQAASEEDRSAAGAQEGEEGEEKPEQAEGEAEAAPQVAEGAAGPPKKLTNQFNFSDRASQTYNNPYRVLSFVSCGSVYCNTVSDFLSLS